MKIVDIDFDDDAFKACCLDAGYENAEEVVKLICRDKGISSTKGLEYFTGLKLLDLTRNELEDLDVSNNVLLEELFAGNNSLQSLDLSKNINLTHLEVFINELSDLDVSKNQKLEEIYANKNDLIKVDLSSNPELCDIRFSNNEIEELDLSVNSKLEKVMVDNNPIKDEYVTLIKEKLQGIELKI
jgi:hypothetical protein